MKIRMKTGIGGTFHGIDGGVQVGDEVEVDDANALRYIANGIAEPVSKRDARKADKAADRFADEVAGAAADEGVALVHPEDRADDLPADARALEPDAVIHDETPAYDAPVPLDEQVDDLSDEPSLVPQEDNPKPVKHALSDPLDEPEWVDDEAAKGVITDPDEVDEIQANEEGVVAEGDPKPKSNRSRGRGRRR